MRVHVGDICFAPLGNPFTFARASELTCAAGLSRVDTRRGATSSDEGATGVQGRRKGHQYTANAGHSEARRYVVGAVESRKDDIIHGSRRGNREAVDDHLVVHGRECTSYLIIRLVASRRDH